MDRDCQSCIKANETGWKLTCSNDVEDLEEPRHDGETLHDSDIQQTRLDAMPHCEKKPHPDTEAVHASDSQHSQIDAQAYCDKPYPDTEAVHASDSQHSQLDAQAYCDKKPHPDIEAQCYKNPSLDVGAQCKDGFSPDKSSTVQVFKEPHPDEEAGLNEIPHLDNEAHYDKGWAWVVLGTTFLMEFFVGGLITSSGVIYAALVDEFNKSRAETGKLILSYLTLILDSCYIIDYALNFSYIESWLPFEKSNLPNHNCKAMKTWVYFQLGLAKACGRFR